MVGGGDEESGQQHQQQRRQRSRSRRGTSRRRRQQHSSAPDEDERGFEITEMSAVYFVLFSSLVLVVLFYSMDHWIFVAFRLLFCLAALQGLSVMLFELIARRERGSVGCEQTHQRKQRQLYPRSVLRQRPLFDDSIRHYRRHFSLCLAHVPIRRVGLGLARYNGRRFLGQRHAFSPLAKLENRHV